MSGMQRILANNRNQIKTAALTASGVAASSRVYLKSSTRGGSGSVALSGLFAGAADAGFDVQIVDVTGTGKVSLPVFRGQGSGVLSSITPGTLPQQAIAITLADMGIPTAAAEIEFYGVALRAVAAGAAGNAITISVDESGLTDTVGNLTTFEQINADTDTLIGPQYDFGAVSLATGGTLSGGAPRLRFAGDPQVFRQYKRFANNQWEYHLVPKPPRVIAKGSAVAVVTGSYSITVTNGTTTETYSAVTLYDFLAVLQASALVSVIGAVVKDLSPGGMATLDLPVKTAAYHLGITSSRVKALGVVVVKPIAGTELLNITCIDATVLGAEVWKVQGSSSGMLPQSRTGVPYTEAAAPVEFIVPEWLPEITESNAAGPAVSLSSINYASRTDTETAPEILILNGAVGIAGKSGTLTATYKKFRKTVDCNALEAVLTGSITPDCLGLEKILDIIGGGTMAMDTEYQTRLVALYTWQKTALGYDLGITAGDTGIDMTMNYADVLMIKSVTQILAGCLALVWGSPAGRTAYDAWFTALQTELAALQTKNFNDFGQAVIDILMEKYKAGANEVLASAGIVPGKSEGSAVSTGCWTSQDVDYWEIPGYAPAYTNTAYVSTKFSSDGTPYSSKEFGFFIACKCPNLLKHGDSAAINISGGAEVSKTWQVGDTFAIPLIAATPLVLSGGQDGNDTVTWKVKGMVSGALPDYNVVLNTPAPYLHSASGFGFSMALGGIPFALGDSFSLAIEGGHFKWRKGSGSWSADLAIGTTVLSDGLSAVFSPGAAPSFAPGDFFSFAAQQPAAPANVAATDPSGWSFTGNSATLTAAWAAAVLLDTIGLARIVPNVAGNAVTAALEYSLDGSTGWTAMAAPVTGRGVLSLQLDAALAVKGLRLTVVCTGGATVGWLWAGLALSTEHTPEALKMRRVFDMIHGAKDSALNIGEAWAGEVAWGMLSQSDFDNHLAMIEDCKRDNDAPLIFIPHHMHPSEGVLVRIQADSVDITDEFQFQPDDSTRRLLALTLPLAPVWR
jgi:hypothetical protein